MDEIEFLATTARRLVGVIELQQQAIDAGLTRPARWRGPLRRELAGQPPDDVARTTHAHVFDWLGSNVAMGTTLDEALLLETHRRLVGDGGFRTSGITIGGRPVGHPPSAQVPEMTREALRRAVDGSEPAALASARLHLELAPVHPFLDGNGRTARLMASYALMRAGCRSTLLTAVEQHSCYDPSSYRRSFAELRVRGDAAATWAWLNAALGAMAVNSQLAAWHRLDRATMADRTERLPVEGPARDALTWQLRRLRAEERDHAGRG